MSQAHDPTLIPRPLVDARADGVRHRRKPLRVCPQWHDHGIAAQIYITILDCSLGGNGHFLVGDSVPPLSVLGVFPIEVEDWWLVWNGLQAWSAFPCWCLAVPRLAC